MRKLYIFVLVALAATIIGLAWAEQITLSTYYPAPYGVYNQIVTRCLGVGDQNNDGYINYNDAPNPNIEEQKNDLWVAGNVGIGTNNPTQKLHVKASSGDTRFVVDAPTTSNYAGFQWHSAGVNKGGLYYKESDDRVSIWMGGTERFTVRTGGNVGIGKTSPSEKLDVNGKVNISGDLSVAGTLRSFTTNGYQRLPSGLIIQWGRYTTTTDNNESFTFPIAFSNACFNVQTTPTGNTNAYTTRVVSTTVTGFIVNRHSSIDNNADFYWFAIGL